MLNKDIRQNLLNLYGKYIESSVTSVKSDKHCMFTVLLFITLTVLMFILIMCNIPDTASMADVNASILAQQKYKSKQKLEKVKDLYMRSVAFGEQKSAILEEAGAAVFYQNNQQIGEYTTDSSAAYNAQAAPELKIKAIITISGKVAACVDINGIAEGIIMTPGMEFLNYGRIIAINEKGIEWEWNGKKHKSEM